MFGSETIAAISTPVGPGGIGIIRISGPEALAIADRITLSKNGPAASRRSHSTELTKVVDSSTGAVLDEALVTVMRAPNSYTRDDVVEVNCHSGLPTLRMILNLVLANGARLAEPGEFTRRAFLSGRIDLTQAQAVIALIQAKTEAVARAAARQAQGHTAARLKAIRDELLDVAAELEAAVDFSDEDIAPRGADAVCRQVGEIVSALDGLLMSASNGKLLEHGVAAAIVGRPNVGKSSLLNALALEDKAIVSPLPGTTRDVIETEIVLAGLPLRIKDTAGWRKPGDQIEAEGVFRTRKTLDQSDIALLVLDGSEELGPEDIELFSLTAEHKTLLAVVNKCDLPCKLNEDQLASRANIKKIIRISAKTGKGLDDLAAAIAALVGLSSAPDGNEAVLMAIAQENHLKAARDRLAEAIDAEKRGFSEEIISPFVRDAVLLLGRVGGEGVDEEILTRIFSRFCIGK